MIEPEQLASPIKPSDLSDEVGLFERLVECSPSALVLADEHGTIHLVNACTEALFGYERSELVGQSVEMLLPQRVRAGHPAQRARFFANPSGRPMGRGRDLHGLHRNGAEFPIEIGLNPIHCGPHLMAMASIIDISERKRIEQLVVHGHELERQNLRINEISRAKSEFVTSMSHELRTPLNAIIGFGELLRTGMVPPESAEYRKFIGHICLSGKHLLNLVNDILDMATLEAGKIEFSAVAVDMNQLAQEVVAISKGMLTDKRMHITVEENPALSDLVLDAMRCKQILYNFLTNAIKFTPPTGNIQVRLLEEGPAHFRIVVQDDGVGIAPAILPRLFSGFELRHAGGDLGGQQIKGLGLSLVKRLVEAQGGKVGVNSVQGCGSAFYAVLPRRPRT